MKGKIKRIEADQGRPIREIILELSEKHDGKQSQVAKELGVTPSTLSYWYAKLGLEIKHTVEAKKK